MTETSYRFPLTTEPSSGFPRLPMSHLLSFEEFPRVSKTWWTVGSQAPTFVSARTNYRNLAVLSRQPLQGVRFISSDSIQFLESQRYTLSAGERIGGKSWLKEVLKQLGCLGELKDDWDGYGARTINSQIIQAAASYVPWLASQIAVSPLVVPLSDGRLQLEWHDGPKTLELEFESPTKVHYLQWHPEAGVEEENVVSVGDKNTMVELLQWFMES